MAYGAPDHANGPPPGWVASGGVLTPSEDVAGYAARGQVVQGVCRGDGCTRRVKLEPRALCVAGLDRLTMSQVQKLWSCNRVDGCRLEFHKEPPLAPLTLGMFVGKPNVRVRVRCRRERCTFFRIWTVEEMIAGLAKRGHDGRRTEVERLGSMMTAPCTVCKRVNWAAEILWVNTDTMGWRALGERSFEPRAPG